MTTLASELAGSSGRVNTAPPGGGTGAGVNDVRMQIGRVGVLTATVLGPHLVSGSVSHPGPANSSAVTYVWLTAEPLRFARPIVPPAHPEGGCVRKSQP